MKKYLLLMAAILLLVFVGSAFAAVSPIDDNTGTFTLSLIPEFKDGLSLDLSWGTSGYYINTLVKTENAQGSVTYTASSSSDGLIVEVDNDDEMLNNMLQITPVNTGTFTVTLTGTDEAGNTARVTIPVIVEDDIFSISASLTSRVVVINQSDPSIIITPRNASGTVTYTSSVNWVTVSDSGIVTIHPTDPNLLETTHAVLITATDSENRTDSVILNIRISAAGSSDVVTFSLYSDIVSAYIRLGDTSTEDRTAQLYPTNEQGTVTYRASIYPSDGLNVTFSGNIATFNATKEGNYSVIITATDSSGRTASTNINATVVSFKLYSSASNINITLGEQSTAELYTGYAEGDVTYSAAITPSDGLNVTFSGNIATFNATKEGNYSVIITATDSSGLRASTEIAATASSSSIVPDSGDNPSPNPAPVPDSQDQPSPVPVPVPVPIDDDNNNGQVTDDQRLDQAIITPIILDDSDAQIIAEGVSADVEEIIFITSRDFDVSEPPEPTERMKQIAKDEKYELSAKINTIHVQESGWYVFEITIPDELVGTKVSDLKFYSAESSEFQSSLVNASFGGEALIALFEANSLLKPDTLAKKMIMAIFCNTARSFTVYIAKILLMLLAGGCNYGWGILAAGIVPVYLILRKKK